MKSGMYQPGDTVTLEFIVKQEDTATFESGQVHPVYATFALGRDAEWTCRQFVLAMKEELEEGIGTFLTIYHHSPAPVGSLVKITGTVKSIHQHELICTWEAHIGDRLVARGETGQKIISKERLNRLFQSL